MFFVRSASARDLQAVSALLDEAWHAAYDGLYGVERVGFWLSMAGAMVLYMGCVGLVKLLAR